YTTLFRSLDVSALDEVGEVARLGVDLRAHRRRIEIGRLVAALVELVEHVERFQRLVDRLGHARDDRRRRSRRRDDTKPAVAAVLAVAALLERRDFGLMGPARVG